MNTPYKKVKLAFLAHPQVGGIFTVYRQLRSAFREIDIDLDWLGVGEPAHTAAADPLWNEERSFGRAVGEPGDNDHRLAVRLADEVERGGYQGVFVNVLTSCAEMSAVQYLPPQVLRVMIVHNITPGTYAAARAMGKHMHVTVGVSPRIRDDLVNKYRFPPERCTTIGNGVSFGQHTQRRAMGAPEDPLRLLFVGRIEEAAKGVFWLPKIVEKLPGAATLTVAGDGPDLAKLKSHSVAVDTSIRFLGKVPPDSIPELLATHDVLIGPSRFEGCPLAVVEAMAAGCVPVLSRIRGVTDWVVDEGQTGLLFPMGDVGQAAEAILRLRDPERRLKMASAGMSAARDRFNADKMAALYRDNVLSFLAAPPPIAAPVDCAQWSVPRGLKPGLRTLLPRPVKNVLRLARERYA